jgi:hypothetical protein
VHRWGDHRCASGGCFELDGFFLLFLRFFLLPLHLPAIGQLGLNRLFLLFLFFCFHLPLNQRRDLIDQRFGLERFLLLLFFRRLPSHLLIAFRARPLDADALVSPRNRCFLSDVWLRHGHHLVCYAVRFLLVPVARLVDL